MDVTCRGPTGPHNNFFIMKLVSDFFPITKQAIAGINPEDFHTEFTVVDMTGELDIFIGEDVDGPLPIKAEAIMIVEGGRPEDISPADFEVNVDLLLTFTDGSFYLSNLGEDNFPSDSYDAIFEAYREACVAAYNDPEIHAWEFGHEYPQD